MTEIVSIGLGFEASDLKRGYPYGVGILLTESERFIVLSEGQSAVASGGVYTLQDLLSGDWQLHLQICQVSWLLELAQAEQSRSQKFSSDEVLAVAQSKAPLNPPVAAGFFEKLFRFFRS